MFFAISNISGYTQNIYLCYEPIKEDISENNWSNIDLHLDTMYSLYSDSIIVPFTLSRIGDELYKKQDLALLKKYAIRMLNYDSKESKTKILENTRTKWEWYCKFLPTSKIYNYGHFYLASSHLHYEQYDSCLIHLDSSFIENYTSLPRNYTYNLSAGLHKTVMRSICLQEKGFIDSARKVLIPYLFLDSLPEVDHFFNHKDAVTQYLNLRKQSNQDSLTTFDKTKILKIERLNNSKDSKYPQITYSTTNDSIVKPSGWYSYQNNPSGNYIRVEEFYVPVYLNIYKYFTTKEKHDNFTIEKYIEQTEFYKRIKN